MPFDSGVSRYIIGTCTVEVAFPVDFRGNPHVCCAQCEFYSRNSVRCRLNGCVVEFPEKYIGGRCPLNFVENERSNSNVPDNL